MYTGALIIFTGANGAGKTSIINELVDYYKLMHITCKVYKFPNRSNNINGKRIDDYLNNRISIESKYDILDMFAKDRETVRKQIVHDMINGCMVFCDRYVYDAIAYHMPLNATPKQVQLYSNVIGYFDKKMPMPTIVYVINGNHLHRRKGENDELFHYRGIKTKQIYNNILNVVKLQAPKYTLLINHDNHLDIVVNYIINDINSSILI